MIELKQNTLVFSFAEVHEDAVLHVNFHRTLRIPDDDSDYPLPPGIGSFPLRDVDDFAGRVPERWVEHGGVLLPMYQSEAMWLSFDADYPFAVKVAAGKINAVTGEDGSEGLHRDPQDYLVVPDQPWLDGYCVEKGFIRQFVAMPLGSGYSAEEQLTGAAEHGGLQLVAYPMKAEAYERLRRERSYGRMMVSEPQAEYCMASPDMGLAPGGRMRQEIYDDEHDFDDWDLGHSHRCFVHLANALVWRAITGGPPPTPPPTSEEYERAGLPWFEYYARDRKALEGAETLAGLDSVAQLGAKKGDQPLPENTSVLPGRVVELREVRGEDEVREGEF